MSERGTLLQPLVLILLRRIAPYKFTIVKILIFNIKSFGLVEMLLNGLAAIANLSINLTFSNIMKNVKVVAAQLLKEGGEKVSNVVVKNIKVKDFKNYTRLSLTLNKNVRQMVVTEDGEYVEGEHNVVFVSAYSIAALLGEQEETAFCKNLLLQKPQLLELVLSYSTVDLILEPVKAGQEYINPFSNKENGENRVIEHDSIYTHIVSLSLGKKGQQLLSKLEDRMLEEAFATNLDED